MDIKMDGTLQRPPHDVIEKDVHRSFLDSHNHADCCERVLRVHIIPSLSTLPAATWKKTKHSLNRKPGSMFCVYPTYDLEQNSQTRHSQKYDYNLSHWNSFCSSLTLSRGFPQSLSMRMKSRWPYNYTAPPIQTTSEVGGDQGSGL